MESKPQGPARRLTDEQSRVVRSDHPRATGPFGGPWTRPLNTGIELVREEDRPTFHKRLEPFTKSNDPVLSPYARELLAQLDLLAGVA
jgi:hypothetical protein